MYRVPGIIGIALIASSACSGDEPVEPPRFPPDPAIVRLEAQPELAMLRAGQTLQLTLRAWDQHGDEVSQPAVQWVSAQPQHARIDGDGTVTGESRGTALIIVASGEARDSVYVKVDEVAWVAIVLGNYHTCGLALDGAAYCWGQNAYGELGDGTTTDRTRAVRVAGGLRFAALSAEWEVSCGLTTSAEPYCWGDGTSGSFGPEGPSGALFPYVRRAIFRSSHFL